MEFSALDNESRVPCSERKPTVLILGPLPPPLFGPAIATRILLNSSLNRAFNLVHLDTNTHQELSSLGKFRLSRLLENFHLYIKMLWLVLQRTPDLVLVPISQTTPGFLKDSVFLWTSRILGRPTVIQLRGSNFKNWYRSCSRAMQRFVTSTLTRTQAVIVLGNKLRYLFAGFYPPGRIFIVPNGCDINLPPPAQKNDSTLKLLYLSNLQPSKGIEDVLRGMARVVGESDSSRITLDVVGSWRDDMQRTALTEQCLRESLPVRFHPPVDGPEKFEHLVNADVLLFTPREPEGHPWVIIEAMAAGLPIISTDQGAITESVIDGVNGFIIGVSRDDQIAEKILLLARDPELRVRMGEASRRFYLEHFTEEKMVQRLACVFNTLLGRSCAE